MATMVGGGAKESGWRPTIRPRITLCDAIRACLRGDGSLHDGGIRSPLHHKLAELEEQNAAAEAAAKHDAGARLLVPLVKTSHTRVDRALAILNLSKSDTFVDLGCGDGRLALYAADTTSAMSYGMEVSPSLIQCCKRGAAAAALDESRVRFLLTDLTMFYEPDNRPLPAGVGSEGNPVFDEAESRNVLQRATAIYVYLHGAILIGLTPTLLRAVSRGARVLTLEHHLPSPEDSVSIAALPPDCQALAHLLKPAEVHLSTWHLYQQAKEDTPTLTQK